MYIDVHVKRYAYVCTYLWTKETSLLLYVSTISNHFNMTLEKLIWIVEDSWWLVACFKVYQMFILITLCLLNLNVWFVWYKTKQKQKNKKKQKQKKHIMSVAICKFIDSHQHQIKLDCFCHCIVCITGWLHWVNIHQVDNVFTQTSVVVVNVELQLLAHVRHQQKVRCACPQEQATIEDIVVVLWEDFVFANSTSTDCRRPTGLRPTTQCDKPPRTSLSLLSWLLRPWGVLLDSDRNNKGPKESRRHQRWLDYGFSSCHCCWVKKEGWRCAALAI